MMGRYIVLILFAFLVEGVFGDEVKSVKKGDRVPLNTGVPKTPTETMLWYFNDRLIALINGHPETSCLYDGEDGRFRHRLDVDYETGSLTITNITTEHAGRYEAEYDEENKPNKVETLNRPVNEKRCDKAKDTKKGNHGKIIKSYSLTVSVSDPGLSPAVVAGMCVGGVVLLLAAAVGGCVIFKYRHSIINCNKKKLKQVLEHVSNDEKQNEEKHMI